MPFLCRPLTAVLFTTLFAARQGFCSTALAHFRARVAANSGGERGRGSFGGAHRPSSSLGNNHARISLTDQFSRVNCAQTSSSVSQTDAQQWVDGEEEQRNHGVQRMNKTSRNRGQRQYSRGGVNQRRNFHSSAEISSPEDRIYSLGRLMTSILRHRALELNLNIRSDGFVKVEDLLKLSVKTRGGLPLSVFTVDDVLKAVQRDNKQRFGLLTENRILYIRANQGHSIKVVESDKLLKPIVSASEIPVCVHGTFMGNLNSIRSQGLKKMGRNHIHFASGLPKDDGVISGMRSQCDVLIFLDVEKSLRDGMKLFISDNGVILTEGFDGVVSPEYFAKISRFQRGKIIDLESSSK